jgi:UDP-glucose 4-epimerase
MNKGITIIGSDSFIAGKYIQKALTNNEPINLYGRRAKGFVHEKIIDDFFKLNADDFADSEVLINFAAIVHRPDNTDEALYKKINTDLPQHLAIEAQKAGIKHFVQMSTVAVYGNSETISENSEEKAETLYGQTKLEADKALLKMQSDDFKVSIIRPPMVYGGGNAPGNLTRLIKFSLKGIPMPFKGVNNKRDFVHVQNLIDVLRLVIAEAVPGIIIPTDRQAVSTEEIIRLVKKHAKSSVRLMPVPKFALSLGKKFFPAYYRKLYGSLHVQCNLPEDIYQPEHSPESGISEMTDVLENQ